MTTILERVTTFTPMVALVRIGGQWQRAYADEDRGGVVPKALIDMADRWPGANRDDRAYLARGRRYEIGDDHPFAAELRQAGYGKWFGVIERFPAYVERKPAPPSAPAQRTEVEELRDQVAALTERLAALEGKAT